MKLDLSSGYRVVPYRFSSRDAEIRFRSSQQPSGRFVLYDLARVAEHSGIQNVPIPESGRSKFHPDMLIEPLTRYFEPPVMQYDGDLLYKASRKVSRAFFLGELRPEELGATPMDPTKNAGAPSFGKKGEELPHEVKRARRIIRGECPPPVTVFHRGKDDEVARPVFGYPASMTLLENMFFHPYQREVMRHHNPYVGGRSYPQLGGELNELRWKSQWVLELDYSGFDGSISSRLINIAFDIIRESFSMDEKQERIWNMVVKYFLTCPVLLPSGEMLVGKRHGVPSGSAFTQLIDSIVNAICIEYARLKTNTKLSRFYVLGDDSVIGVQGCKPCLEEWSRAISDLGVTVNPRKSKCRHRNDSPYFLGHYWSQFVGTRTRTETWEKILSPERLDPRLFSKDPHMKNQAFIERLEAYRLDNPDLWSELTKVINYLRKKHVLWYKDAYAFSESKAFDERARWDSAVRHMKRGNPNVRQTSTVRYFFSSIAATDQELVS